MSGFLGDILYLDLASGQTRREPVGDQVFARFLGGRGLNALKLWELTGQKTKPLAPENPLIFGAGALNATAAPSAGRTTFTFLSPATGRYFKSSVGGHFGPALRKTGLACLVITGKAPRPVYLFIDDDQVSLRPAKHLWGKDVRRATIDIKAELGDEDIQVACIGQAGERRVVFAAVMFTTYNAAGRGGGGAVMGGKNLKAVAVRGSGRVELTRPREFGRTCILYRRLLAKDTGAQALYNLGTAGLVELNSEARLLPSYNFQRMHIPNAHLISGYHLEEAGFLKGRVGCSGCTISCHRFTTVDEGPQAGAYAAGPEFETASALGSGCGITDTATLLRANELCNLYGLDSISAGTVIQWAMECFEKGILSESELGGPLLWGDGQRVLEMIRQIAHKEGFGAVLARGVKRASRKVGGGSAAFAMQARGLEQSRVEVRIKKGNALSFAVNPRGPDHLHAQVIAENGRSPEARALIERITGDVKYAQATLIDKRAEIVRWHEDCYAVTDALGFCSFATTLAYAITPKAMAHMLALASGLELSEEEIMRAGRRIITLEHLLNLRAGLTRKDHRLPRRTMNDPVPEGPGQGMHTSRRELDGMLDQYYDLHGWDRKTTRPGTKTLAALGLAELAAKGGG